MNANKTVLGSDLGKVEAHTLTTDELDEIPELTDADMVHGQWRIGSQAVGGGGRAGGFSFSPEKAEEDAS